ncbi:MAG: methylenetetrahydrofolate--tRNA-(uracil(54)-C(5))-methyltransferase (FADH(2)-oxidizing) TrmFO [Clostridia bacterium]|nr:methylenetetrahydrofolate--tRNA-(uracil(54)-C(5))-methyltransferase (FADH(2)-oxidizing) TrmFO [Clostridia bacterium]
MSKNNALKIVGAGLAGCEAALHAASRGIKVKLYDIKPQKFTPAHRSEGLAELVCSNSLKSNDVYGNACGLLKEEMRLLGSKIIEAADKTSVPAGKALAVNRELFSQYITDLVRNDPNIEFVSEEVSEIDPDEYTIIATGPLTTAPLAEYIKNKVGACPYFFDAAAPIIDGESIDFDSAFIADRYGEAGSGDYVNCPLTKEEYDLFISELLSAERAVLHDFEDDKVFDGCMPIEVMAARGHDTLRFGPMKPTGLTDPKTGRWPYACVQLRRENVAGDSYNAVGFQTNLLFSEQKRVLSIIPALKNAEYFRYGVMHKNTYLDGPKVLNNDFSLKNNGKTFFAGQITGVEGYVESAASGLIAAINAVNKMKGKPVVDLGNSTVIGALSNYVATPNENFQPMNANYGILDPIEPKIRDKTKRKEEYALRSLSIVKKYKESTHD